MCCFYRRPVHAQLVASASILFGDPVQPNVRAILGAPVFVPDLGYSLRLSTIQRSKIAVQNQSDAGHWSFPFRFTVWDRSSRSPRVLGHVPDQRGDDKQRAELETSNHHRQPRNRYKCGLASFVIVRFSTNAVVARLWRTGLSRDTCERSQAPVSSRFGGED